MSLEDAAFLEARPARAPVASRLKRFVNYAVDYLVRLLLALPISVLAGTATVGEGAGVGEVAIQVHSDYSSAGFAIAYAVLLVYYAAAEYLSGGRTLGKLVTRTRAVQQDGSRLTLNKAIQRSLWRLVPLEAFTFLAGRTNGWHDEQTGTKVIDARIYSDVG